MTPSRPTRRPRTDPHPVAREILAAHVRREGLKQSRQRNTVLEVFLQTTGHLSVDEITARVRARDPEIGQTTVYRTMKLLADCGLATPQRFGDRETRYERHDTDG